MEYIAVLTESIVKYFQIPLAIIGIISAFKFLLIIAWKLYEAIIVFLIPIIRPANLKKYGEWAVLTGGSSGIGKSYARHLAKRGMNIIVVSNELEALRSTVKEIKTKYGVQCCYIHLDFTESGDIYDFLIDQLEGKDIGVFVNGAGIIGNLPCKFLEESNNNILTMVELHISAVTHLTRKISTSMIKKGKGIIVNIASMSSLSPVPYLSIYSACKSFSDRLTRAVNWEYKGRGIKLQSLNPCYVSTRMTDNIPKLHQRMLLTPSSDTFCKYAVGTLGLTEWTSGYWIHGLIWFIYELLPNSLISYFNSNMLKAKKQ